MVKIDELKIFLAVAETGSFVGAAGRLDIDPPIVSRNIKSLEYRLNTTLFNRTTRRLNITSDGQWLLKQAEEAIDAISGIRAHFLDTKTEPEGQLVIDAATPFALHLIAPKVTEFVDRYPKIDVTIGSNESVSDLIGKNVDVAIRIGELKDSTLKAKKIGRAHRAVFASPKYLKKFGSPSTASDLQHHRCLGFTSPKSLNVWPLLTKSGEWVTIRPYMQANSGEVLKYLSALNNGLVCLSTFSVRNELERGELVAVLENEIVDNNFSIYAVYYSERSASRPIRLFLEFLASKPIGD